MTKAQKHNTIIVVAWVVVIGAGIWWLSTRSTQTATATAPAATPPPATPAPTTT